MAVQIRTAADWDAMAARGLTSVVDPMILRAGEKFLSGGAGVDSVERCWQFISRNVHALAIIGRVEQALHGKDAIALNVDGRVWWPEASDREIGEILPALKHVPALEPSAFWKRDICGLSTYPHPLFVDCFCAYTPFREQPSSGRPAARGSASPAL